MGQLAIVRRALNFNRILTFPQKTMNSSDRELEASSARPALRFRLSFSSFAATRHL